MEVEYYADDPMKALVRKYDFAVMRKGGRSLFAVRRSEPDYPVAEPRLVDLAKRWHGKELEALRIAYHGPLKLEAIAHDFGTSYTTVSALAGKHGWNRRYNTDALPEQLDSAQAEGRSEP